MIYCITTLFLVACLWVYFQFARKQGLYDVPNERSSHRQPTIIGGGVIFWFAIIFYALTHSDTPQIWTLTGAFSILAIISLWDDVHSLPWWSRLGTQTLSMLMIFQATGLVDVISLWMVVPMIILCLGIVNVYNFMDGINGMHALYSVVVLGALQVVNMTVTPFVNPDFIWFALIAECIFLFCNFRRRALCFTGDIGSIVMATWVITLLLMLFCASGQGRYILFLAVYGVDAVCTILHRICIRQNIVQAHRLHLYQILANEAGIPVFGSEIEQVRAGCLASASIDYITVGRLAGEQAALILKGSKAGDIPARTMEKQTKPYYNSNVLKGFDPSKVALPGSISGLSDVMESK